MIELSQLRFAVKAADFGSFNRASVELRTKQTTISRHIAYLEDRLGFALFDRSAHGVTATPAGEAVLCEARRILDDVERLLSASGRGHADATLHLGHRSPLSAGPLNQLIGAVRAAFADMAVDLCEDDDDALFGQLRAGRIDIAVLPGAHRPADVRSAVSWREQIFVGMRAGHRLTGCARVDWQALLAEPIVLSALDAGEVLAREVRRAAVWLNQPHGVRLVRVARDNLSEILDDRSVTLVTESALGRPGDLVHRALHGIDGPAELASTMLWRDPPSPAAQRVIATLRHLRPGFAIS